MRKRETRMGNRTAKFVSALVGSIIAGAPLAAVSQNAPAASTTATAPTTANAASDCLASPKGAAPQGQHWFYRLDRATKRQCWYLRAEGAKTTQSAQAMADMQNTDSAGPPSVQNARAEYVAPQTGTASTAPAPAAAATPPAAQQPTNNDTQQPAVATRWPDASATAAAPAPAPAAATVQPSAKPAKPATPVALAAAEIPADKPTGSLPTLLLVIGGALALAGVLASIIYRFAGGRGRAQPAGDHRRVNWDDFEPHDHEDSRAPWLNATPAETRQPRPVDFDAARQQVLRPQAPQIAAFSNEIGRIAAQSRAPRNEIADLDEADIFDGEFEIETSAPRLAANDTHDEETVEEKPADRDEAKQAEDGVDIDVITAMLERLAQEGPRLSQPSVDSRPDASPDSSPGAVLVDLARSPRGQSAARA
ncbi:hypothetical protein RAD16_06905 [Bradyrhizobium sp. 18BD]